MAERKRKSKAGAPRTEVFAMRLDPKLKYLAELASRKQRRSLANFMEWAIELGLKDTELAENRNLKISVWDKSTKLWDVDEADRLANLAFEEPTLMAYDEQLLWKIICETGYVWKGSHDPNGDWQWSIVERNLIRERLRQYWDDFKNVAAGDTDRKIFPATSKKLKGSSEEFDDEVPF